MKHIISKMFGADNTDEMNKLTQRIITANNEIRHLTALVKEVSGKLEQTISAVEIMINKHNDLSKEFKDYAKNKNKPKYIPPQH